MIEKRLENLEWERERKDREKRRNNIITRGVSKWREINIEQEVKEFIKESLKIEMEIGKDSSYKHEAAGVQWQQKWEAGSRRGK